jgi:hypothetical protein
MHLRRLSLAVTFVALAPLPSLAQDAPLAGLVARVIQGATFNRTITPTNTTPVGGVHEPHFLIGESLLRAPREMNIALGAQINSFPLSSSSGGFSFATDPATGEVTPASTTFGPAFAERGLTIGKGKFNLGMSYQATSYDAFEGVALDSGGLSFIRVHSNCCPPTPSGLTQATDFAPEFERDLLQTNLSLEVDSRATALFANYGVSDRFDVGLAVPFVSVDMLARVDARVLRTASDVAPYPIHSFDAAGGDRATFTDSGSSSGLGDILVRAKYNFTRTTSTALAAALDLRLPTGDKDELLGTGATQAHTFFIYSGEYGIFSPHVNIGYTFSNGEASEAATAIDVDEELHRLDTISPLGASGLPEQEFDLSVPDEFNYTFGVAVAAGSRVTLGFDVRGRTLRDVTRFELRNNVYPNREQGALPTASFTSTDEFSLAAESGNLNLALGIVGAKINIAKTLLLNVSVLFPLNDNGLKPNVTPVIGFDYVF